MTTTRKNWSSVPSWVSSSFYKIDMILNTKPVLTYSGVSLEYNIYRMRTSTCLRPSKSLQSISVNGHNTSEKKKFENRKIVISAEASIFLKRLELVQPIQPGTALAVVILDLDDPLCIGVGVLGHEPVRAALLRGGRDLEKIRQHDLAPADVNIVDDRRRVRLHVVHDADEIAARHLVHGEVAVPREPAAARARGGVGAPVLDVLGVHLSLQGVVVRPQRRLGGVPGVLDAERAHVRPEAAEGVVRAELDDAQVVDVAQEGGGEFLGEFF